MDIILEKDKARYGGVVPYFQIFYRKYQGTNNSVLKLFYKVLFVYFRNKNHVDMSVDTEIGEGLYFCHPYGITINPRAKLGKNISIHKGATIGQESRGKRKGTPIIGDEVWIGLNATIVGAIHIGNDVMIAANSFVNFDVPDHSIVIGNPGIIKHKDNATEGYIGYRDKN